MTVCYCGSSFSRAAGAARSMRRRGAALAAVLLLASLPAAAEGDEAGYDARPIDPVTLAAGTDNAWRRPELEVYRWDSVPGFLIVDTRDYLVQQRIFHRLAFFVEKAGHVGRLGRGSSARQEALRARVNPGRGVRAADTESGAAT